ncbi:MAG: hypothetical protein A4S14_02190 [Proteobacteria bacterium SG_bin9]|nr:MAG: hypothetical protein A4S14_02190 [Proteobacteria bacterium SG_bin9]
MTMAVYTFEVGEDQEWIFPADESDYERFYALDGSVIADWRPPTMRIDREAKTYSDLPWLGEHLIFLKKPAAEILRPVLLQYGQLLPVHGEEVWLFNATTVIDALDHERSQIVTFDDGGILAIERHVFHHDRIGNAEMFKLPMRASAIYVTGPFVERVRRAGLRGVSFRAL